MFLIEKQPSPPIQNACEWSTLVTLGCDKDVNCQNVIRQNWPNRCVFGDVCQWSLPKSAKKKIQGDYECFACGRDHTIDVDVCVDKWHGNLSKGALKTLVAGPPCPPWSSRGKRQKRDDPRFEAHDVFKTYAISEGFDIIIYECVYDKDVVDLLYSFFIKPQYTAPRLEKHS
jgi:hypothetical protein